MIRRLSVIALVVVCSVTAQAQAPAPSSVTVNKASVSALQETSPAPLTIAEKKDIEIVTLKAQLASAGRSISELQAALGACQAQLGPALFEQNRKALSQEQAAVKDAIEKARPGYAWDPDTGTFMKKPADKPKS